MSFDIAGTCNWYLEGFVDEVPQLRQIAINTWPFRVGRRRGLAFCLSSDGVSKEHAEILQAGSGLMIRDLGSRNGTFVNGQRVDHDALLKPGDVLHFANQEFRLGSRTTADAGATVQVDRSQWVLSLSQFKKLFEPGNAVPFYQSIVELGSGVTTGYEVLARSRVEGLQSPKAMFDVAAGLSLEAELSRLFRAEGVRVGRQLPGKPDLFLNTHPAELGDEQLLGSLRKLRAEAPSQLLTLEIHEAAVTDPTAMQTLRAALTDLDIRLAYDDFGAGQARLIDLIEVPPDYLKFDVCLVRDLHLASDARRQMLETLVRMAHDLGVTVLAEGIENQGEAAACRELGFDLVQGYHFGKPMGIESLVAP
jgi:EAL domain-containing protein (putative c-di-GMP-specific phosphodiesterase class I)